MYIVGRPLSVRSIHGFPRNPLKFPNFPSMFPLLAKVGLPEEAPPESTFQRREFILVTLSNRFNETLTCESEESYQTAGLKSLGENVDSGFTFGKTVA